MVLKLPSADPQRIVITLAKLYGLSALYYLIIFTLAQWST